MSDDSDVEVPEGAEELSTAMPKPRARRGRKAIEAAPAELVAAVSDEAIAGAAVAQPAPATETASTLQADIDPDLMPPEEVAVAPVAAAPAVMSMDDLAAGFTDDGADDDREPDDQPAETASDPDDDADAALTADVLAALGQTEETVAPPADDEPEAAPSAGGLDFPLDPDLADGLGEDIDFKELAATLAEPLPSTDAAAAPLVRPEQTDDEMMEAVQRAVDAAAASDAAPAVSAVPTADQESETALLRRELAEMRLLLEESLSQRAREDERPRFKGHVVSARFVDNLNCAAYRAGTMGLRAGYTLRRFFQKGSIGLAVGFLKDRVCMPMLRIAKVAAVASVATYAAVSAVEDLSGKTVTQHADTMLQEQGIDGGLETASQRVNDHFTRIIQSDPALAMTDYGHRILEVIQVDNTEDKASLAPETSVRPKMPGEVFEENGLSDEDIEALGMNSNRI